MRLTGYPLPAVPALDVPDFDHDDARDLLACALACGSDWDALSLTPMGQRIAVALRQEAH